MAAAEGHSSIVELLVKVRTDDLRIVLDCLNFNILNFVLLYLILLLPGTEWSGHQCQRHAENDSLALGYRTWAQGSSGAVGQIQC